MILDHNILLIKAMMGHLYYNFTFCFLSLTLLFVFFLTFFFSFFFLKNKIDLLYFKYKDNHIILFQCFVLVWHAYRMMMVRTLVLQNLREMSAHNWRWVSTTQNCRNISTTVRQKLYQSSNFNSYVPINICFS